MGPAIVKAFLPWLVFFSFANGTELGIKVGSFLGFLVLFLFNRRGLKNGCWLSWAALFFLFFFPILSVGFKIPGLVSHSLFWGNAILGSFALFSLIVSRPVTFDCTKLALDRIHWSNFLVYRVNQWITFFWGMGFLLSAGFIGFFLWGQGSKFWCIDILPAVIWVIAVILTMSFPRIYSSQALSEGIEIVKCYHPHPLKQSLLKESVIAYRAIGQGAPIVLLPEVYFTMYAWDPEFIQYLSHQFQLLIFDYPGFGFSLDERKVGSYSPEWLADQLLQWFDQLQFDTVTLLGFGMGGLLAQKLMLKAPHRIQAAILINTPMLGVFTPGVVPAPAVILAKAGITYPSRLFSALTSKDIDSRVSEITAIFFPSEIRERWVSRMKKVLAINQWMGSLNSKNEAKGKEFFETELHAENKKSKSKAYTRPILIIAGEQDELVPFSNAVHLKKHFKQASLVTYPNTGHGIIYQYPFDLAGKIKEFLK